MKHLFLTTIGKTISVISKTLQKGNGSTWPGHIALSLHKNFVRDIFRNAPTQVILVIGTNGKTTTAKMLTTILRENGYSVFQNTSGANLLNGIASATLLHTNIFGKLTADFAVFEVDENNVPFVLQEITPTIIIALNLFRDQLDRYGELDAIAKKWKDSFVHLSEKTSLILNADDPLIAFLGSDIKIPVKYFGLEEKGKETVSAADTLYCPRCRERLRFTKTYYAHLGIWSCPKCNFTRPTPESIAIRYPLEGTYNRYNTLAAAIAAKTIGITEKNIQESLTKVTPAFGRQEKLTVKGKKIQILLSKNPTSMNESLQTIQEKGATHILFVLNDRIPDGRDVSWIWDIALESYVENFRSIFVGGDRAYDMALRLQYAQEKQTENFITDDHLPSLLQKATTAIPQNETLYILPTYSAMLEVRKLLLGRKML